MFSKWLTARPKNLQPAAPRKRDEPYWERWEESGDECFACCAEDEDFIKLEYNSYDDQLTEEVLGERQCGDGQESPEPEKIKAMKKSPQQVGDLEDPRNPTFIPRNGSFFQHDLRCTNDGVLRSHRKKKWSNVQNKSRRKSVKRLQGFRSHTPKRAYKKLYDLLNRQSPSKNATYCENWEEAEDDCYACCAEDDSTNVVIKLEYNSIDAPITVEEDSDVVVLAIKWEWKCGVQQERPEPEGMKAKSPKQLDDSEDPRNPTNISQNRSFFQHDLRRTNDGVLRTSNCSNKKRRMHDGRWKHDKFRKDEQGPKSREEIIATYGYDIRAWKNPYENPQRRLKKQRSHQCCLRGAAELVYKDFCDLHNRQCPTKSTYSEPVGCKDDLPAQSTQNASDDPGAMTEQVYKIVQAQTRNNSREETSDVENENIARRDQVVDDGHRSQKRPLRKVSYARTPKNRGKKRRHRVGVAYR
ncbi:hypothetical protein GDO81_009030 [Engystomops pustulosus]|uniref:Protein CASC3 n=1 Tax=Engystomops pustulosus TaxID=76066 RepID=A0AAV7BN50_ENGPU|nr:hypothetical protein GDO81_009030 [Engystomops pustulosus]KAG8574078.1 hypothetical protein GDO81_009030 [Engystomops pustulosus]